MWRILYYLTFGLVWLGPRCHRCGKRIPPSELDYSDECDDCYYSVDGMWQHWLCNCGNFIENGLHCPSCGAEPPWGCPCEGCEDDLFDEYDDDVFEPDDE